MPTVLLIAGWRFFFYSNEKFAYNLSLRDKREVKKIFGLHYKQWNKFQKKK